MDPNVLFYWIIVPTIKIAIVMAILPLGVAFFTWAERKIIADIQVRMGPRRVGPFGLLQPIADVVKLFLKEDIIPAKANKAVFMLAPVLAIIPAFVVVAAIPFGPEIVGWAEKPLLWPLVVIAGWVGADTSGTMPMMIVDLDIGLLFILAVSSLGVFALLLAGWASNSKYPLLGGLRSAAQLISYEIPLGFALIAGLLMTRTLSMQGIIDAQMQLGMSLLWLQPLSLVIYFISGVAETNRVPFDLPEAETELVSGFHTEYSGMKFAFFFLAEYINMVTVSAIAVTMFLGGWLPPLHGLMTHMVDGVRVPYDNWFVSLMFSAPAGFVFFIFKVGLFYYMYFLLRATLPRYRYDQLMALGWKVLIPLSMLNVGLVAVGVVLGIKDANALWGWPMYLMWGAVSLIVTLSVVHTVRTLVRGQDAKPAQGTV